MSMDPTDGERKERAKRTPILKGRRRRRREDQERRIEEGWMGMGGRRQRGDADDIDNLGKRMIWESARDPSSDIMK